MSYLLDSNACIAIINKKATTQFETSLNGAIRSGTGHLVPSIGVHELWFGVARSGRVQVNRHNLIQFLQPPFKVLEFDEQDAAKRARSALNLPGKELRSVPMTSSLPDRL